MVGGPAFGVAFDQKTGLNQIRETASIQIPIKYHSLQRFQASANKALSETTYFAQDNECYLAQRGVAQCVVALRAPASPIGMTTNSQPHFNEICSWWSLVLRVKNVKTRWKCWVADVSWSQKKRSKHTQTQGISAKNFAWAVNFNPKMVQNAAKNRILRKEW